MKLFPPCRQKKEKEEKPGCVAAGIVTGRTAGYLLSSSSFVLFICNHLHINENALILFGDHLDWGTYGRLLASLLSDVAKVGTAGKGAGGPKSLY